MFKLCVYRFSEVRSRKRQANGGMVGVNQNVVFEDVTPSIIDQACFPTCMSNPQMPYAVILSCQHIC